MGFLRKTFKKIGKGIKKLTKKFAKFMNSDVGKFISLAAMVMMTAGAFGFDMFGKKTVEKAGQDILQEEVVEEVVKEEVVKDIAGDVTSEAVKDQISLNLPELTGDSLAQAARDKGLIKDVMKEYTLDSSAEATLNSIANSNVMSNSITTTLNTASNSQAFQLNANAVVQGNSVPLNNALNVTPQNIVADYQAQAAQQAMTDEQIRNIVNETLSTSAQPKGLFGTFKKGVGDIKVPFTDGMTFAETGPGQFIKESVPLGEGMLATSPAEYYTGGTFIAGQLADKPDMGYSWGMDTSAAFSSLSEVNTPTLYGTGQPINATQMLNNNSFLQDYSNSVSQILNQSYSPFNIPQLANANVYGATLPVSARANIIHAYNKIS
jgi:hypothetical protein